jgi:hypothetical protein
MARGAGPEQEQERVEAISGLRWYDDEQALALLEDSLRDRDGSVRSAAQNSLAFMGTQRTKQLLKDKLNTLPPVPQIYAACALQQMDSGIYLEVFRNFLRNQADKSKDYAATVQAIKGLRDAYLREPVSAAVEALHDERREIRLAATLALSEHKDIERAQKLLAEAAANKDPHFRLAASRALWALTVVQKAEIERAKAELALAQGNPRGGQRFLKRVYNGYDSISGDSTDYRLVLTSTLSVSKPLQVGRGTETIGMAEYVFQDAFDPAVDAFMKLASDINAKARTAGDALRNLEGPVSESSSLRRSLAEDPNLSSLRNIYKFRVLTGLQQPTEIDNLKLP